MAAKNNRFCPISHRLLVGALGMCALLVLAAFAGSPARSGAQSAPARQTTPPPAQPAPKDQSTAPNQPAPQPAPDAQSNPAESQKNADSDDDKWPDPEWVTQQNQAGAPADTAPQAQTPATAAPASNQPSIGAQSTSPVKQNNAAAAPAPGAQSTSPVTQNNATAAPAPVAQSSPARVQQDGAAIKPGIQPATAAAPTLPRPPYPGMTPEEKRKLQVAQQCAGLLKLATDLKAQVDKSRKDELSVTVVRKAAELEQMAHKVRNGAALSTSNE